MPNFSLSQQPRFPIVTIETDHAIREEQIAPFFEKHQGITLCVRSAVGHANRGGYFFCVSKESKTEYKLETMEGISAASFDLSTLVQFINHASGRSFDRDMLDDCQNQINFRED